MASLANSLSSIGTGLFGNNSAIPGILGGLGGLGEHYLQQRATNAGSNAINTGLTASLPKLDPLNASRGNYVNQLNQFMSDPSSFLQGPYAQAILKQGEQAVTRSKAAQGYTGSGNMATALHDYGMQTSNSLLNDHFKQLFDLSGGNIGMLAAGDVMGNIAGVQGMQEAGGQTSRNNMIGDALGLGSTLLGGQGGGILGNLAGTAGNSGGLLGGLFGGGGAAGIGEGAAGASGLSSFFGPGGAAAMEAYDAPGVASVLGLGGEGAAGGASGLGAAAGGSLLGAAGLLGGVAGLGYLGANAIGYFDELSPEEQLRSTTMGNPFSYDASGNSTNNVPMQMNQTQADQLQGQRQTAGDKLVSLYNSGMFTLEQLQQMFKMGLI